LGDLQKYGSSKIPIFGFVMKNAVTSLHTCGSILTVKTACEKKTKFPRLTMPEYPKADTTTAAAVMVLQIAC
jgi:hypothetical protein